MDSIIKVDLFFKNDEYLQCIISPNTDEDDDEVEEVKKPKKNIKTKL